MPSIELAAGAHIVHDVRPWAAAPRRRRAPAGRRCKVAAGTVRNLWQLRARRSSCSCFSWQRGGGIQVAGSLRSLPVLLVPSLVGILSALLQQCRCDVVVDVLLLEHVLVCELHLASSTAAGRLTKADELVVDEAILDMVELVHVLP